MSVCLGGVGFSRNLPLFLDFFVKSFCAEFHENPTDSLVSRSQTEGRVDVISTQGIIFLCFIKNALEGKRDFERRRSRSCAVRYVTWPVGSKTVALRGCNWLYGVWLSGNTLGN
jgi:hypothetical protein